MKKKTIEVPMYFVDGFVDGLEKAFPESSSNHDNITSVKIGTAKFLREAGQKIRKIEEVRLANFDDPTQTPEGSAVNTWKYAKERFSEIDKQAQELPNLKNAIASIEDEIDKTLTETANSPFAMEARQRIASMGDDERGKFVAKTIHNEDPTTSAYVLGAPAFLSGLPEEVHSKLKESYKSQFFSEEMKAIKALHSMDTHLQKGINSLRGLSNEVRGLASANGALEKAEKAEKLSAG